MYFIVNDKEHCIFTQKNVSGFFLMRGGGSHGGGEFEARGHRGGDRFAVRHPIPLQHVKDILC